MQPNNYSLNLPDPTQNVLGAINLSTGVVQLQAAKQQLAQAQVAAEQQKALHADLNSLSQNPSPSAVASMMVKYPQLSEQLKRGYDALGTEQQKAKLNQGSQVYAALLAGDNDTAYSTLKGFADAYRNSGMKQDAESSDALAQIIKLHPEQARTAAGLYLASAMGPDKFQETFGKLESERRERDLEPSKLTETQAAAREAAVKANFAESNAVMDLKKKGWDIYKIQEDVKIARENNRIAALNAATSRANTDLEQAKLQQQLDDAKEKRDQMVRDHATALDTNRTTIDNSLNTIDRVLNNPNLNDVLGSLEGSAAYPHLLSDESQNAIADIETIKSQQFLNQLIALKNSSSTGASGLGALSKEEGERLINGIQSLSRRQGESQFTDNLKEVQRLLLKSRKGLTTKYGAPDTIPDTPNAAPGAADIDALVKKYGG